MQHYVSNSHRIVYKINDLVNILFYYIELIPSIILVFALYKSYQESKKLRKTKEMFVGGDTEQISSPDSHFVSESEDSKYFKWFKNNLSSGSVKGNTGYKKMSMHENSPTPATGGFHTDSNLERDREFLDMSETLAYF